MKNYNDLIKLTTFKERFRYLKIGGLVGEETFGFERELNQRFYHSREWKHIRNQIIVRDNGCDLGCEDRPINGKVYIHHMNPVSSQDIVHASEVLINPNYLICCSHVTHNAIHYGDEKLLCMELTERAPNDTCPWK